MKATKFFAAEQAVKGIIVEAQSKAQMKRANINMKLEYVDFASIEEAKSYLIDNGIEEENIQLLNVVGY